MPLLGRDDEFAVLRRALARLVEGSGGCVWIEGEPGIGKSALVRHAYADAAELGVEVYWGQGYGLAEPFPLGLVCDALSITPDAVDPDLAEIAQLLWGHRPPTDLAADPAAAAAERVLLLVERRAQQRPVLLVADDLQWADRLSLGVWDRLQAMVGQTRLLLVGVCRPVPVRPELLPLRHASTSVIELGGLRDGQVTDYLAGLVGGAPGPALLDLAGHASGNPLYLKELADSLRRSGRIEMDSADVAELRGDGAPPTLAAAIATRLDFLSARTTALLRVAVLLEPEFTAAHLAVASGRSAWDMTEPITEAVTAGVLTESGDRLAFRHVLIRDALEQATPASLRHALHRQAARALAEAGAPIEQIAHHLLAGPSAADDEWSVAWVTAHAPALCARVPQMAIALLGRALDSLAPDDPRGDALAAYQASALISSNRYEEAAQIVRPRIFRAIGELAGRMGWVLVEAYAAMPDWAGIARTVEQILSTSDPGRMWTGRLRARRAQGLLVMRRFEDAEAEAQAAQAAAQQAGDRFGMALALHILARVEAMRSDHGAVLARIDEALALLGEEPETVDLRLLLLGNRYAALGNLGCNDEAEHVLLSAVRLAEHSGRRVRLGSLRLRVAEHYSIVGRWDDALAELAAADELNLVPLHQLIHRGYRALIAVHQQDRPALDAMTAGIETVDFTGENGYHGGSLRQAWALSAYQQDQPAQALARFLSLYDDGSLRFAILPEGSSVWFPLIAQLALDLERQPIAEAVAEAAARIPMPLAQAGAGHCRGLLAGDPEPVLAAARMLAGLGQVLQRGYALENAAVLSARRGDLTAARDLHREACEIYAGLDAGWGIQRADARLRALGVRRGQRGPRRRPQSGWQALTPTELRIARLVADGMSNNEIATQLFLSRRTVQTHVSNILTKLDATSRIEIARRAMAEQS